VTFLSSETVWAKYLPLSHRLLTGLLRSIKVSNDLLRQCYCNHRIRNLT
jgi:hypothetical protein